MRDEAREYFDELGLSYSDINEGDILILSMLVNKELKRAKNDLSVKMRLSQKIKSKYNKEENKQINLKRNLNLNK